MTEVRMTDAQLIRALRSVGLGCLAAHRPILLDAALSVTDAARKLQAVSPDWTLKSCRTRVGHARRIAQAGRLDDALRIIAASRVG